MAVSALRPNRKAAADFAWWIASAEVQAGLYASSGGQPAMPRRGSRTPSTRRSPTSTAPPDGRSTDRVCARATTAICHAAARLLNDALQAGWATGINALFRESLPSGSGNQGIR